MNKRKKKLETYTEWWRVLNSPSPRAEARVWHERLIHKSRFCESLGSFEMSKVLISVLQLECLKKSFDGLHRIQRIRLCQRRTKWVLACVLVYMTFEGIVLEKGACCGDGIG